jgi:hypothetical protein
MRRVWLTLSCAMLLCFIAAPAHAQIWRYIYELSGPGPFRGLEFERRLLCFSVQSPTATPPPASPGRERAARALEILGPGCFFRPTPPDRVRRASINLAFGLLDAKENNLRYANPSVDREVKLTSIEPSLWWRPTASVEVGTGGGMLWFSGPAFASFRRGFFEPVRIDVKPLALASALALRSHAEWTEFLSLRAGLIVIPHGFRAEDFGAVPGSFQTSREALRTFAIFVDLEPVARSLRTPRRDPTGQRP